MQGFPPVSAMCLTYGRPHLLEEAIASFLRQDYRGPKELVVLNDFADQTLVYEHAEVRIINTAERFPTVGEKRNACAELARHDLLFVWDDDDLYLPWRLSLSVRRLDESKGYYKCPQAWMLNYGRATGPTTNLYHSAACFTRELFERAGRYPHIGSGQDWGLEDEFKKLIPDEKDDDSLDSNEIYYIYRWAGTGSYHLSAFGRDEGKSITGNQHVAEFVDHQIKTGEITTGIVRLDPVWRQDYHALVRSHIASLSDASPAEAASLAESGEAATEASSCKGAIRIKEPVQSDDSPASKPPLISCIMPTYGRPELVQESLAMFLAQDYEHKELLIVNDCPGQVFEGEFPQVRIINCRERFPTLGQKRNFAISQAAGDWIAVWDDDDVYFPWRLSFSMQEILGFRTPLYRPAEFWAYWGEPALHDNQCVPGWISHPLMIFRRDLWDAAGRYPPMTLYEDAALFEKMHRLLRTDWLAYPVEKCDRFMIMRAASMYCHTSIQGGKRPPNTTPGVVRLSPRPVQDAILREAAESLIRQREEDGRGSQTELAYSNGSAPKDWLENVRTRSFLDDLPTVSQIVGFGSLGRHGRLGYEEKQVVIQGKRFRHALSTHPPATLTFALDGRYSKFESRVAVNDDVIGKATRADFFVLVDGNVVACATEVVPGEAPRRLEARMDGAKTLELQVRTESWDHCHAVWLEPTAWLCGANESESKTVTDCLGRAKITIPEAASSDAELCIATVVSPGYESWLESFLSSLSMNGECGEARIAVFCFGCSPELERIVGLFNAVKVDCESLAKIGMASKSVLYSVGKVVPARKYLCFDVDMLVLGSLRGVVSALEIFPASSVMVCRDAADILTLGMALAGLYESNTQALQDMAGVSAVGLLDDPLVVNDGFFAATRPAINAVDDVIRGFPGAIGWIEEKPSTAPWRNQFVFNLALSKLRAAVEIDESMNWQLNRRGLEWDAEQSAVRTTCRGNAIKVLHFNGAGRHKYPSLPQRFRSTKERFGHRPFPISRYVSGGAKLAVKSDVHPRFVICSAQRVGSHMLATALNGHPDLKVAGEILQRPELFGLKAGRRCPLDEAAVVDAAFRKFNGCIIHRQHLRAMEHLPSVDGLKVIFLMRRDWLAQLVSEFHARRTNVWHVASRGADYLSNDGTSNPLVPPGRITVPPEHCFAYLREQARLELIALERLRPCPVLTVTYEELQSQWEENIRRILEFLDVPRSALAPATLKQGAPPHQSVTNYSEIVEFFSGTRWDLAEGSCAVAASPE